MLDGALAKFASALIFRHIYNSLIENRKLIFYTGGIN